MESAIRSIMLKVAATPAASTSLFRPESLEHLLSGTIEDRFVFTHHSFVKPSRVSPWGTPPPPEPTSVIAERSYDSPVSVPLTRSSIACAVVQ